MFHYSTLYIINQQSNNICTFIVIRYVCLLKTLHYIISFQQFSKVFVPKMFYDIIVTNKKVLRFIKTFTMVSNKFRSLKKHIAKDVFENSLTFEELEDILSKLPSNIYLKVAVGKYIFATHY